MQIKERVFLVTGAASGLGAATARGFAAAHAHAVIVDHNEAAAEALAEVLARDFGVRAVALKVDVSDALAAEKAVQFAVEQHGAIHGLVNCAGIVHGEKILARRVDGTLLHDPASFLRVMQVNLVGTFNMIRCAVEAMCRNAPNEEGERGVIVNTASIAAFDGQIGQAAYAASKGGVLAMTLPLARELAHYGIRVMTIAPGVFETPMMHGMAQAVRDTFSQLTPFPARLGKPEEYAALVRHIVENPMLNGEVIRLDGALRMPGK